MSFVIVYDANVLYKSTTRDLLIRIAMSGLVQAKWTDRILDEVFTNLAKNRADLDPVKLARTRDLMNLAIRDVLVADYEPIERGLDLPDPGDNHVLAAAIKSRAQVIVTGNTRHFPAEHLAPWNIDAKTADEFVMDQLDLKRDAVVVAVQQIADSHVKPPNTFAGILKSLETDGLAESVAVLRG
ncbi:MAG: PIN domain-containing protein [Candidatus Nanopelagicales bacterium]